MVLPSPEAIQPLDPKHPETPSQKVFHPSTPGPLKTSQGVRVPGAEGPARGLPGPAAEQKDAASLEGFRVRGLAPRRVGQTTQLALRVSAQA